MRKSSRSQILCGYLIDSPNPQNVKVVGAVAVRFTVPDGYELEEFVFLECPTWDQTDSCVDIHLYDTTVEGTIFGTYHAGEYLVVMDANSATNSIGPWTNKDIDGQETYVNGALLDGFDARTAIIISENVDTNDFPAESTVKLDFKNPYTMSKVSAGVGTAVSYKNGVLKVTHQDSNDPDIHINFDPVNSDIYKCAVVKVRRSATEIR